MCYDGPQTGAKLMKSVGGVHNLNLATNRLRSSPICRQSRLSLSFTMQRWWKLLICGRCANKLNIGSAAHFHNPYGYAPDPKGLLFHWFIIDYQYIHAPTLSVEGFKVHTLFPNVLSSMVLHVLTLRKQSQGLRILLVKFKRTSSSFATFRTMDRLCLIIQQFGYYIVSGCFDSRDVGNIQKVGGGTCNQGHPHMQKRALVKLTRGTLHTNVRNSGGMCPRFLRPCSTAVLCFRRAVKTFLEKICNNFWFRLMQQFYDTRCGHVFAIHIFNFCLYCECLDFGVNDYYKFSAVIVNGGNSFR